MPACHSSDSENPRASEAILALGGCWVLLGSIVYYWIVGI